MHNLNIWSKFYQFHQPSITQYNSVTCRERSITLAQPRGAWGDLAPRQIRTCRETRPKPVSNGNLGLRGSIRSRKTPKIKNFKAIEMTTFFACQDVWAEKCRSNLPYSGTMAMPLICKYYIKMLYSKVVNSYTQHTKLHPLTKTQTSFSLNYSLIGSPKIRSSDGVLLVALNMHIS